MDIAKIRKKIKEEAEKGKSEDKPVDEPSASTQQQRVTLGETEDRRQKTEYKDREPEVKSPVPAQAVSEHETVKEKSPVLLGESARARTESVSKTAKPVVDSTLREDAVSGIIELLTFQLATEEFAFRISEVEEILTPQQITMVPKAPDYVLGITSVRGKVMPVLDLKKRLSIKDNGGSRRVESTTGKVRKKILTLKGPKGLIGIMIDRINGVIRINESDIAEPPAHLSESDLMFVGGVVLYNGRFISVIRLEEAADINLK